ncbi:MAG TPA: transposase [Paludibacter sp.]|nr:transposase [Paludibacter sp.]
MTELKDWLLENGVTHVAMESTGIYWKPVHQVLEPTSLKVWVVNARHIKYVPGHKTDKQDSAWICKLSYIVNWEPDMSSKPMSRNAKHI